MAQVIYPRWRTFLVPWHKLYTTMDLVPVPLVPTCTKKWVYKTVHLSQWFTPPLRSIPASFFPQVPCPPSWIPSLPVILTPVLRMCHLFTCVVKRGKRWRPKTLWFFTLEKHVTKLMFRDGRSDINGPERVSAQSTAEKKLIGVSNAYQI